VPTLTVKVTGSVTAGSTLSAAATLALGAPQGTLSYDWQNSSDGTNWNDISGATNADYQIAQTDVGSQLRVIVNFIDQSGQGANATSNVVNLTPPTGQLSGSVILTSAIEGNALPAGTTVATFSDTDATQAASTFTASINWGDGTTTSGIISGANGSFTVSGGHVYADEGQNTATVTVTSTFAGTQLSLSGTVAVSDALLTATPGTISGTEGTAINPTVATFTDANPNATLSDFSAMINWGDGSVTPGTVVAQAGGGFAVQGGHTYAEEGHCQTTVTVDDIGGSTTTTVSTTAIVDPPVVANPDSNGVAKGQTVSVSATKGVLANDSDPDDLTVEAVDGRTQAVGNTIEGKYGSLTLNADGSYVYKADPGSLPSQIVAQDTFSYSVSDGHGGVANSTLSLLVFNPSTYYQSGANTTLVSNGVQPNVLDGSAGNDVLIGGRTPDVLVGGNGDTLTGGGGPDTFLFRPDFGLNTITDFNVNNSAIQFDKSIFAGVSDILKHTADTAHGAVISDGHGDTVTLAGVTLAQLQAHQSDFHLV
jgi:VCBS repeat-containing protein